jgi:hypothetical protein
MDTSQLGSSTTSIGAERGLRTLCNKFFFTYYNSDMTKTLELAVAKAAALPEAAQ